jgi:tetratricopeptide (TPR) repeat protein
MMKNRVTQFRDSLDPAQLFSIIEHWRQPEVPPGLKNQISITEPVTFRELSDQFRKKLEAAKSPRTWKRLAKPIINWLYDFIRLNIKRGRVFDLREMLTTGKADCLGYAKIFTTLGRHCGLDLGIVEVILDNRGRNVPHTATLVILAGNSLQFVDFWYGSRNIKHQRLGLKVKYGLQWRIEDINFPDLKKVDSVTYLPDYCVDAITLYIEGNRSLKKRDYLQAIEKYSQSIKLYPQNARTFYNRAIAFEKLGKLYQAKTDYARALHDDNSLSRTLATQPRDIVNLIRLDEENIPEFDQQIFLLRQGFITGKKVSTSGIARKMGLSLETVDSSLKGNLLFKT